MTIYDLVGYHGKDDYVRYDIHGNDARVNFLGSYIEKFEYVLKMIVAKNWKSMLAEMDQYLLTHKSLARLGCDISCTRHIWSRQKIQWSDDGRIFSNLSY